MDWFLEHCDMWKGMALSVEVEAKLAEATTPFQHIEVYRTATYGNMLVLDGNIQCTERDEFAYHEMLVHPAMCCHPAPERVLVIGGGDGGALREIVKHPSVKRVTLCEIDEAVVRLSKQFMRSTAVGFDAPQADIVIADGIKYLEETKELFDVIIVDSSDPIGPAEALFDAPFYRLVRKSLKSNGIVAAQSEHIMIHRPAVDKLRAAITESFPHYAYLPATVPSYPGGGVGIALGGISHDPSKPLREPDDEVTAALRYYTPGHHLASAVLPKFAEDADA